MAMPAWRAQLRERVLDVEGRCGSALELLADAQPHLAAPVHTGDAGEARTVIELAQESVSVASDHLTVVASLMRAAQFLALHGGSFDPKNPVPSIHHLIRAEDLAVRSALEKLWNARRIAEEAYESVELCCDHLSTACLLLDHPGLPGVDGFINAEHRSATHDLEKATVPARI